MKFKFSFFFCLFFSTWISVNAQVPYHKMLGADNSWFISGYFHPFYMSNGNKPGQGLGQPGQGQYIAKFDSVVNNVTYKKFTYSTTSAFWGGQVFDSCLVREDTLTQRIYVIPKDSTVEKLVIDFSLNVSDSIFLTLPNPNYYWLSSGYYKVDSIRYKTIAAGSRKHLYLAKRNAPQNILGKRSFIEWIESVGAVHFPLNLIDLSSTYGGNWEAKTAWCQACGVQYYGCFISCKSTNNTKIYHDTCSLKFAQQYYLVLPGVDIYSKSSCDYFVVEQGSGIAESEMNSNIKMYPIPANEVLNIQFGTSEFKPGALNALTITGEILPLTYSLENDKIKCDVHSLKPGIYILVTKTADGAYVSSRFVKE